MTNQPLVPIESIRLTRWSLCRVLLKNDANFPWLILVPQRENIREVYQLSQADRASLIEEIARASQILEKITQAFKLNVAALGNAVPQLHVHIVARFCNDAAWPRPIWGVVPERPYTAAAVAEFQQKFLTAEATI